MHFVIYDVLAYWFHFLPLGLLWILGLKNRLSMLRYFQFQPDVSKVITFWDLASLESNLLVCPFYWLAISSVGSLEPYWFPPSEYLPLPQNSLSNARPILQSRSGKCSWNRSPNAWQLRRMLGQNNEYFGRMDLLRKASSAARVGPSFLLLLALVLLQVLFAAVWVVCLLRAVQKRWWEKLAGQWHLAMGVGTSHCERHCFY